MRASKLQHRILKFINYANYANLFKINEKCYFSVISWPILILFVFSDRPWCGLRNFYTEFWNSLLMQIYANLFKINEKCYFSVISWPILILFVLSDRAWCGLQNFYTEFWNSLIRCVPGRTSLTQRDVLPGTHRFARLMRFSLDTYFNSSPIHNLFDLFFKILKQARFCLQRLYPEILFAMLKGFLNHGCVIVNDLLLGTRTRVHTVSFPARRARLRRSAGHNKLCILCKCIQNQWKMLLLCHFLADFDSVCFIW